MSMHELSVVLSIIDIAEEQVKKSHAQKIESIELQIGSMAGIEMDALEFSWQVAVKNTVLESAERIIDHVPALARCNNCGHQFAIQEPFEPCPVCNEYLIQFLQGKEMRVKALVVS